LTTPGIYGIIKEQSVKAGCRGAVANRRLALISGKEVRLMGKKMLHILMYLAMMLLVMALITLKAG